MKTLASALLISAALVLPTAVYADFHAPAQGMHCPMMEDMGMMHKDMGAMIGGAMMGRAMMGGRKKSGRPPAESKADAPAPSAAPAPDEHKVHHPGQ